MQGALVLGAIKGGLSILMLNARVSSNTDRVIYRWVESPSERDPRLRRLLAYVRASDLQ